MTAEYSRLPIKSKGNEMSVNMCTTCG